MKHCLNLLASLIFLFSSKPLFAYDFLSICGELQQAYSQIKNGDPIEKCKEVQKQCRNNSLKNISSDFCDAAKSWRNMCDYSLSETCQKRSSNSGTTTYNFQNKMAEFCSFNKNRRRDRYTIKLSPQKFPNCEAQKDRPLTVNSNTSEEFNCGEIFQANIEERAQANSFSEYSNGSDYSSFTAVDSTNPNLHYRSYQCFSKLKISDNGEIIALGNFTVNGEQYSKEHSRLCILKDTFGDDEIYCKEISKNSCVNIIQFTERTSFDRMIDNLDSDSIKKYTKSFNSAFKNTHGKNYIKEIEPQSIKKGDNPITKKEKERFLSQMKDKCHILFPNNSSGSRGGRTQRHQSGAVN